MVTDDPGKGKPGGRGQDAKGMTGGAGGVGGEGGAGEETGGSGGSGGTGGAASGNGQRLPVVIEDIADPDATKALRRITSALIYLAVLFTVSVLATWLTEGPPF